MTMVNWRRKFDIIASHRIGVGDLDLSLTEDLDGFHRGAGVATDRPEDGLGIGDRCVGGSAGTSRRRGHRTSATSTTSRSRSSTRVARADATIGGLPGTVACATVACRTTRLLGYTATRLGSAPTGRSVGNPATGARGALEAAAFGGGDGHGEAAGACGEEAHVHRGYR